MVEFHSFATIGASAARDESVGLRIGAADEYARVEVGAPLRAEFLDPKAQLTAVQVSVEGRWGGWPPARQRRAIRRR